MPLAQRVDDLHRLHLKRHGGVLAKHGAHRRQHRARLAQVGGRALYEDVARGQRHLLATRPQCPQLAPSGAREREARDSARQQL